MSDRLKELEMALAAEKERVAAEHKSKKLFIWAVDIYRPDNGERSVGLCWACSPDEVKELVLKSGLVDECQDFKLIKEITGFDPVVRICYKTRPNLVVSYDHDTEKCKELE